MLTGQNNGEKDVLRAYYRGLVNQFATMYCGLTEVNDITETKIVKEIRKNA